MATTARNSLISVLAALLCAIAAAAVCATAPSEAFAEELEGRALPLVAQDGLPFSGKSGTCTWGIDADGVLTIAPEDGIAGQLEDWGSTIGGVDWYPYRESIRSVRFEGSITAPTCCYMFFGCKNLTLVDLGGLNTASASNLSGMFSGCSSLASLDASMLDTANVTNMSAMFQGCSGLNELALRKFDTNARRFIGFDTEKVTNMENMFKGCSLLAEIDLSSFVTSKTTNTKSMFEDCSSMKSIFVYVYNNGVEDVGWVMKKVSEYSSSNMFLGCTQLVGEGGLFA